jgi:hypothetical protein
VQTMLPPASQRFAFTTGMVWQVSYKPGGKLITKTDQWTVTTVPEADGQRADLVDTSGVTFSYELDKDGVGLTGEWQSCHLPGKLSADHKSAVLHPLADAQECLDMFGATMNVSIGGATTATGGAAAASTMPASTATPAAPGTVNCAVNVSGAVSGTASQCTALGSDITGPGLAPTATGVVVSEETTISLFPPAFRLSSGDTALLEVQVLVTGGALPRTWTQATVAAAEITLFKGTHAPQAWQLSTTAPAPGTMSLTLTGFDSSRSASVFTNNISMITLVPHGSLIADLPALLGSGATGTVHISITF